MFNTIKSTIKSKTTKVEEPEHETRMVIAADKLPASEINNLMSSIGLNHLANFR